MLLGHIAVSLGSSTLSVAVTPTDGFTEEVGADSGTTTGLLTALATGGISPYTYAWTDEGGLELQPLGIADAADDDTALTWSGLSEVGAVGGINARVTATDSVGSTAYRYVTVIVSRTS